MPSDQRRAMLSDKTKMNYEVRGTRYAVRRTTDEIRGTKYEVRDEKCELRNTRYKVLRAKDEVQRKNRKRKHNKHYTIKELELDKLNISRQYNKNT